MKESRNKIYTLLYFIYIKSKTCQINQRQKVKTTVSFGRQLLGVGGRGLLGSLVMFYFLVWAVVTRVCSLNEKVTAMYTYDLWIFLTYVLLQLSFFKYAITCLHNLAGVYSHAYLVTQLATKQKTNAKKGKDPKSVYLMVPVFLKRWTQVLRWWGELVTSSHSPLNKAFPGYNTEQQLATNHWATVPLAGVTTSTAWDWTLQNSCPLLVTSLVLILSKNYTSVYVPQITRRQIQLQKKQKNPQSTEKIYKYYNKIPVKHNLANPSKLVVIKSDPNKLGNLQDSNEKKLNDSQIDKDGTLQHWHQIIVAKKEIQTFSLSIFQENWLKPRNALRLVIIHLLIYHCRPSLRE